MLDTLTANVGGFGNKTVTEVVRLKCIICLDLRISVLMSKTRAHPLSLLNDERPSANKDENYHWEPNWLVV